MKKPLAILLLALLLVGCSSNDKPIGEKNTITTTVCTMDKPYSEYQSGQQTYVADGDVITSFKMKALLELETPENVEKLLEITKDLLEDVNRTKGLKGSIETYGETSVYDILEIDLTVVDFDSLEEFGVFPGTDLQNVSRISLDKSVKEIEAQGFVCKLK